MKHRRMAMLLSAVFAAGLHPMGQVESRSLDDSPLAPRRGKTPSANHIQQAAIDKAAAKREKRRLRNLTNGK